MTGDWGLASSFRRSCTKKNKFTMTIFLLLWREKVSGFTGGLTQRRLKNGRKVKSSQNRINAEKDRQREALMRWKLCWDFNESGF